jgi:hypothetical protein
MPFIYTKDIFKSPKKVDFLTKKVDRQLKKEIGQPLWLI